jgi:hypothetical protein
MLLSSVGLSLMQFVILLLLLMSITGIFFQTKNAGTGKNKSTVFII